MDGVSFDTRRDWSSAFLKANLERLRVGPRSRAAIEAAPARGDHSLARDGSPVLRLGSASLGIDADDLWLSRIVRETRAPSVYVVFGLGLGQVARQLHQLTDAPILIYEPDPGLARSVLSQGPSDLGHFPIVCDAHELTQIWQGFCRGREHAVVVNTPGYAAAFGREDGELRQAISQLVQRSSVNDATHRLRAREWVADVLENLELLREAPCFLGLAQKYQGVPAFIVGAGPSLGKNGALLAEAARKGIVFAVNSSALALARYGVTPQVVACMESIDLSHLLRQVPYLDEAVRAFSLTAHPTTLRTGGGPLLPVYEGLPQISTPLAELYRHTGLPVCGSVSTLAFSLAQRLGCSPIVFVGQDLAYTHGAAYAPGSAYEKSRVQLSADGKELVHDWCDAVKQAHNQGDKKMIEREPLREVEAWGGEGTVLSTIGFSAVRSWLELASEVLKKECPDVELVNATEGGARIAGFREQTLAELLEGLPERGITAATLAAAAREASPPLGADTLRAWAERQRESTRRVGRAARRVRRLAKLAHAATERDDTRRVRATFERLSRAEVELKSAVARAPFIDAWSWADVDRAMERGDDVNDTKQSAESALWRETQIATAIENCSRELARKLEQTAQTLGASAL